MRNGEKLDNKYISMIEAKEANAYVTIDENNLYGILNEKGEELVKNEYLYIEYVFDKYFVAYKNEKGLGVIDKNGNVIISFEYDVLSKIGESKILKGIDMEENRTDIFSSDMQKIISVKNANIEIHDEYIEIYNNEAINFITNSGELKKAKDVLTDNSLFAIYKEGKWGFEDKDGNINVEPEYDYVTEFNIFGFAGVKKGNKWGVMARRWKHSL